MPIGAWSPPTPEYLTAPGYATYAPTRAYAYTPTGGDWSGTYPSYGGGGGGGLTSGDFEGGTDTSTLGGLLTAASVLGGANNLSSLLTGQSLMEHAGIPNPFSNFLGGDGLNLQALNPYSNTPLTALFGEAGRNLGLASSAFPNALPGGVGGSVGIGPSGYLSPDALAGEWISNAVPPGSPSLLTGATPPPMVDGFTLSAGPWTDALQANMPPPMVDAFPMVDPASVAAQPGNLGLPIDATQLYGDGLATSEFAPTWAEQAQAIQSAYGTTPSALTTAQQAAMSQQALQDLGGIQATGYGATPTMAQQATMDLGGIGATGFGAAPAIGAAYLGAPMSGYASGALTGGALGGPGAAAGLNAGFMAPLGLAFYGMSRMAEDPTADPRMANQLENYFQRALQGPEQEALELENLKQQVFLNPASIEVMKRAAEGGVPGAVHRSGGADIVGWPEPVSAKFREFLPELERVAAESGLAHHGGMYNIGDYGQMGSPPIPYGENRKPVVIDQAYDAGSYSDASRREQRFYPDMFQAP